MDRRAPARRPLTAGSAPPDPLTAGSAPPDADLGDPGLFGPDSRTWRIDREAFLLLGAGPRALLLQLAHPAIAAGVDEHSDFRADPWGRLAGTLRSYLRIVYGTTAQARAEIARLGEVHRPVRGPLPGGRGRYSARDPELGLWVHATLVDSTIVAASEWLAPLDRPTRARLYEESLVVGRGFGIPDSLLPADLDAFERYLATMTADGGPVAPGPLARDLAASILAPPLGPPIRTVAAAAAGALPAAGPALDRLAVVADRLPAGAATWLLWPAIGLLPDRIRDGYGFAWGPVERAVAGWLVAGWRAWNGVLPAALRSMPQAVAADRRIAGA